MSDQFSNFPMSNAPLSESTQPPSMFGTWLKAVTHPSSRTYIEIASQPNASTATAIMWVFLTALLESFVSVLVQAIGGPVQQQLLERLFGNQQVPTYTSASPLLGLICGAPALAVWSIVQFLIMTGLAHLIARAFGGKATFEQLAFVFASIWAPVALVSTVIVVIEAIPFLGVVASFCFLPLLLGLAIYVLVIEVIATSAVHQIGAGGATVAVVVVPILLFVCIACAVIGGLMALGPEIGNVFSSINNSLQSVPTP